ncbi:MAG: DegQ family serine endoprotease [Alphaproteobacteria bacterium]|nr:DegQ family serine endoprotease [Alphaproteobacteria bacterium]
MSARLSLWAILASLTLLAAVPASAQTQRVTPQSREQVTLSFAPLVKRAAPAVVNVYTKKKVQQRAASPLMDDPFFRRFFGDQQPFGQMGPRVQNSLGSGVIVRPNGTIVTNHHVVKDADEISVVLSDRREFEATLLRSDERTDLAVLKIDPRGEELPFLELRNSDDLEVGDFVLAIGNPFGVGQTVTQGIVSAVARTAVGITDLSFFIQTDAAINPGNSGGALVAMDGRLVGINTAIFSRSGGSIGIGFAIPSNMVATVIQGDGQRIVRAWLGAAGDGVTSEVANSLGLDRPVGVVLKQVYGGGPAERAGLRTGDVVTRVDGREVEDFGALRYRVATLPLGGAARIDYVRRGRAATASLPLEPPPANPAPSPTRLDGRHPLAGAVVGNLSPAFAEELGLDPLQKGVVVLELRRSAAAARIGLQPGDIVLRLNDRDIDSIDALKGAINSASNAWRLRIRRGDQVMNVVVQ